jgi:hypothetical protein
MSAPVSPASARINNALTDFASAYKNSQFIADAVCPILLTDKESGSFQKRLRKDQATPLDNRVGARGAIKEASYDLDSGTYLVEGRGLKQAIPEGVVLNADAVLDPKQLATQNVMQRNMLAREIRVADLIMTGGNWAVANTGAVSPNWDDEVDGVPLTNLQTGLQAIPFNGDDVRVIGVCSDVVFDTLSRHPQIMGLRGGGGTQGGPVSPEELASFLRIDSIFVSKVHKNTANTGQTASYSRVWTATTFAFVVVPTVLTSTEATVFAVTHRQNLPGSQKGFRVREWREEGEGIGGTDYVAAEHKDDENIIQNDAGYLFTSVL